MRWLQRIAVVFVIFLFFFTQEQLCDALENGEVEQKKIDAFTQWFQKNQGVMQGIEVYAFPGMGNGFRTTKAIQMNDLVLQVPNHLIMTVENMKDHPDAMVRLFHRYFTTLSSEQAMIMWLLYEKNLGIHSHFYEYIQILPSYVSSLMYFTAEELNELQNPVLESQILQEQQLNRENYHSFLQTLITLLKEQWAELSPQLRAVLTSETVTKPEDLTLDALRSKYPYSDYLWALSILNSRALRFHGEMHLIPMADIFNYEKHPQPRRADNGNFFLQFHQIHPQTRAISIFADRAFEHIGQQLFEDYGDNTNEIYLTYHGFIPHVLNPFHCVSLSFPWYWERLARERGLALKRSETDPWWFSSLLDPSARELLQSLQFPLQSLAASTCVKQDGQWPRPVLVFFSILAMTPSELSHCQQIAQEQRKQKLPWLRLYQDCGFEQVNDFVERELSSAYQALASGVSAGERAAQRAKQRQRYLKKHSKDAEEEEEEGGEAALLPLSERVWDMLQDFLQATIDRLAYSTSLEEDRQLLLHLAQLKKSSAATAALRPEEAKALLHQELALKYRSTNKAYFQHLCSLYELEDCAVRMLSKELPVQEEMLLEEVRAEGSSSLDAGEEESEAALREKIEVFNAWFLAHHPQPCHIRAHLFDNHYRIGTIVATPQIAKEEVYLGVPAEVILSADQAFHAPGIQSLVQQLFEKYGRRDEFHELLFFLLYERFAKGAASQYAPYLQLLPSYREMQQRVPVFWSAPLLQQRLAPSFVLREVLVYQERIRRRFAFLANLTEITSFFEVSNHQKKLGEGGETSVGTADSSDRQQQLFTWENYLWATAILDSRSIWWEGKRHLVPMLDFINCAENPQARQRVHSTQLDATKQYAITAAGDDYVAGDQLFENYGQPNHIYFLYHGFVLQEPANSHDCLHFELSFTANELKRLSEDGLSDYLQVR